MKSYKYSLKRTAFLVKNKMKSKSVYILTILLILSFCLISSVGCSDGRNAVTDTLTSDDTQIFEDDGRIFLSDGTQTEFRIIRPADCDDYIKQLSNSIREQIKNKSGVNIRVFTDATPVSDDVREILVGRTNRAKSAVAYEGLKYNDWRICAENGTVAIAAFKENTLELAVKRFMQKTHTEGKSVYYNAFKEEKLQVYDVSELSLGGVDISNYTIVCENESELTFSESVRDIIAEYSGNYLDIADDISELKSNSKPLYIGSADYPGEASKKDTTAYILGEYGGGYSLWYVDSSAKLSAFSALDKGLSESALYASLEALLPRADLVAKEEYMNLKIMSFNVLNGWNTSNIGARDDLAAAKILEYLPDVIGFQEFDPFYREAEKPLPYLIASKYTEVNVTDASTTADMSWNPIFYRTDRLTLQHYGSEVFRDGTFHQSYPYGGKSMFRTISWAIFEDKESKQSFIFVNTHYDFVGDAATMQYNQRSEANQLVELVRKLKATYSVETVFVTGDYNATTNGIPSKIMKDAGFADTWSIAANKDNVNSSGTLGEAVKGTYDNAIDHVFCMADSVTVENYKTVTDIRAASDHCPIFVSLSVKYKK